MKISSQPSTNQKKIAVRSWIAGLLIPIFFLTTIWNGHLALASEGPLKQTISAPFLKSLKTLVLPATYGRLEETFEPTDNSPKIILIQDAHAVPDAQRSIRHLLLYLQEKYGIKQVAVEGASQKLDPQMFASFPDKKELAKVLRVSMDRGELSGSVAAALMGVNDREGAAGTQPDYFGVEDWKLYEEGLKLYLKGMSVQEAVLKLIDAESVNLEIIKKQKYSKQLLIVDLAEMQFRENNKDLMEFFKILAAVKPPEAGSEIALFLAESDQGKRGQEELEKEVRAIAEDFKSKLAELRPENQRLFGQEWQSFQTGELQVTQFALALKEMAARENIKISMSKSLLRGAHDQKRLRDIEGTRFFKDLETYTQTVKESLFLTDDDRDIDRKTHELLLLKKLAMIELSREEWEEVKTLRAVWQKEVSSPIMAGMIRNLEAQIDFYDNAEKRDQVFFEKLKERATMGAPLVMIAGGFHAQGLMERFKSAGMAYALVMPNIAYLPEKSNYRAHMQGDVSWKKYFKIEKGRINLYEPFVRYTRDQLLNSHKSQDTSHKSEEYESQAIAQNPRLLKDWRDQLIRDLSRAGRIEEAGNYTRFLDEKVRPNDTDIQNGLQKLEEFFDGLRTLDRENNFQAPNILALLKPANVPSGPVAGALTDVSLAIGAMSEVRKQPASQEASYSVPRTTRSEMRVSNKLTKFAKENVSDGALAETFTFTPENRTVLRKLSREAKQFFLRALDDENDAISEAFRFGVDSHDSRDAVWVVRGNDSMHTLLGLQQTERLPNFHLYESEISKLPKGEQLATGVIVLDKSLRGQGLGVQLKKAAFQYMASTGVSFYYAVIAGGIQENRASYQMTLRAAADLNMPVYQLSKSDEFLIQLRPDVFDPETPQFLQTLKKVSAAKSEMRGLTPAAPEAMWEQLKGILAKANQDFIKDALGGDWVSCGPASRTFAREIGKLIPGAEASIVYVSKFRQESLGDPELFSALQTLVQLIQDFAAENGLAREKLLDIIFGKTKSYEGTVLQEIAENESAQEVLEKLNEFSARTSGASPDILLNLLKTIKERFSDSVVAVSLSRLANQLRFYPGGYPTPPMPPATIRLTEIPSKYFASLPTMLASPYESYGASRHIASLVRIGNHTHLVDLTVSQYDGMSYPVTQVSMIEDVNDAKLIEHGYILEKMASLEDINNEGIGDRDAALSYIPFVERAIGEQAGLPTEFLKEGLHRSEVRAEVLTGEGIRLRIREAAAERKLLTGTSEEETRKAFELQLEILRLSSAIHEPLHGIGDVHGSAEALKSFFESIPSDEQILQVGDVIDRGEDSPEALDILRIAQKKRVAQSNAPIFRLLGNHEMMLLEGYLGNNSAMTNWYRELPVTERQLIFGAKTFNLSGNHDADGLLARSLLQLHPVYRPMIEGMLKDIERGDLMGAAALQGQIFTHAGIDPERILPDLEDEILEFHGVDVKTLTPTERAERVSDAEIVEHINRTVRQAFVNARNLSDAGIPPQPAFWHLIFLQNGIFWNRNMENKKAQGRQQSFGHTPMPNLTLFNKKLFLNFDTSINRSRTPIALFVDKDRNVLPQTVIADTLLPGLPMRAAAGALPAETASAELQRGWPEFEHFENLPRKVSVETVPAGLKGLEAELLQKLAALTEFDSGKPLFSPDETRMLASRLVNLYQPDKYILAEFLGRWFSADREEWRREFNMQSLQPFDWQEATKIRGYGALIFNDDSEKTQALQGIYEQWTQAASQGEIGRTQVKGGTQIPQTSVPQAELKLGGLALQAQILQDGSLQLTSQAMGPVVIPLQVLEKSVDLGRTSFDGVSHEIIGTVSRTHARVTARRVLTPDADTLKIQVLAQDAGSRNGSKLNGQPLAGNAAPTLLVEAVLSRANLRSEMRILNSAENAAYTQSFNLTETPAFQKVMAEFRGEPGTAIRAKLQEQDLRNPPELPSQAQSRTFLKDLGTWAGLQGPALLSYAGGFDVMKPRAIAGDVTDVISFGLQPFGSSEDVVNVMAAILTVGDINLWRLLQGGAFDTPQHLKVLLEHKKILKPEGGLGGLAVARLSLAESEPSGEIRSIRYFKINEDQSLEFLSEESSLQSGNAVIEYRVSESSPWQRFWYVNLNLENKTQTSLFESFIQRFKIGGVFVSAPMRIFEESSTVESALELLHAMNPATPILSDQSATSDGKAMPFQPQHSFWLPDQPSRRELTTNGLGFGYSNPRSFNFNLPAIPGYFAYAGTVANVKKVRSEVRNAPTDIELEVRAQMLYPWDKIHSRDLVLDTYDKEHYTFVPSAKDPETGFWKRQGMPQGVELVLGTWEDIKRKTDPDHRYNYPGMDFQSMQRHVVMRYQTADGKRMSFYAYDDHVYSLPYALEARERGEIQEKGNRHLFLDDHPDNFKVPEPRRPSTAQAALKLIADDQGMINDPRMNNFNSLWPEDFFEEHVLIYDKRVATTYNARRRSGTIHRGEPLQGGTPVLEMDWTLYPQDLNRIRDNDQNVFVDIDTDMTGGGDSLAGVLPDAESVLQTYVDFLSKLVFEDGVTPALVHASTTKGQGAPYGDVEIVRYLARIAPTLFFSRGRHSPKEILAELKVIQKQHEPYVRSHLRSEVRSAAGDFQESFSRRNLERKRFTRRFFLSAAGVAGVGLITALAIRQSVNKADRIRKSADRRKSQGPVPAETPWDLFPLEDSNLSEMGKIKRSLQVTADWLIQEGYGDADMLDEFNASIEGARPASTKQTSLMAKVYDSEKESYVLEINVSSLQLLIREIKTTNSKDLFLLILGGLLMRESFGMRVLLKTEARLAELSTKSGVLERERRSKMPLGEMNRESLPLRQFLQKNSQEIDRLLISLLAFEHLEAEWEWAFYAKALSKNDYKPSRIQELLATMQGSDVTLNRLINRHVESSQLLIETGGDSFKIFRTQLTGVTFHNYQLFRQGELIRRDTRLPSANFLLANYGLVSEMIRFRPDTKSSPAMGLNPDVVRKMGFGQWPEFSDFDSYAKRLWPDFQSVELQLRSEFPAARIAKPNLFDEEVKPVPTIPKKRSEVRSSRTVVEELKSTGESLAEYYVYGRVTNEILSEIAEQLDVTHKSHEDVTVEQIIEIIRRIVTNKIHRIQAKELRAAAHKIRNTLTNEDTQLLQDIVQDNLTADFKKLNGGFIVGATLSPEDGKTMAANLIAAIQKLHESGALKHALVAAADSEQRQAIAEERSNSNLPLEALEVLNALPGPANLATRFEKGQDRLPNAVDAGENQQPQKEWLVSIELLEDSEGLSVSDLEMLEAVSVFMQLAAGTVIAREANSKPEEIQSKLNQLFQIKGSEIDEDVLNAVFKPRGEGFSLSQRGLLGVLSVLQSMYAADTALQASA